ncbi:DUF4143 domain-containing protein [Propioniciclava sinopodophylli]|uniref:DUF4143 domain-containing protein n=1 Tax=Propioniciclava sinopodophylli TaxID=1837344 RepID=UPI0019D688C8
MDEVAARSHRAPSQGRLERHWLVRPSHGLHQRRSRHCGGREYFGALAEQCVALELRKQSAWTQQPFQLYHYRDLDGLEVDRRRALSTVPDRSLSAIAPPCRSPVQCCNMFRL